MICLPFWLYRCQSSNCFSQQASYSECASFPPAKKVNLWVSYPQMTAEPRLLNAIKVPSSQSPQNQIFPSKKKQVPGRDFCWVSSGGCSRHSPWKLVWKRQHFSEVRHHFWSNKYLKTATTRTGHGGFQTIYGGFSSWSNLTWAYFLLVGLKLDQLEKLFSTICHQKCLVEIHRDTHWKFMFSRFGACDSVPAVLVFGIRASVFFHQKQL